MSYWSEEAASIAGAFPRFKQIGFSTHKLISFSDVPRIKGAPAFEIEQAPALGTVGDIVLVDLTQYQRVMNSLKTAISADVQLFNDNAVFRFAPSLDGWPLWASPITPFNSTVTRSPFIALAAR